ncbi:hypothetical protein I0C86_29425 [Plantactinospora sp. S1510]|uniref:Tyr recombinase domain-containing protein n=1 Tax=Plantactinospora alkalitolerans TaxID=2789879 RepID=A0ABS0H3L0_9ACTN|nr:hypothetical protein [Plantactinospora alkalitolerans]MBF9133052.1 hypothetical protein [Plantactinospora alkalitolerans]
MLRSTFVTTMADAGISPRDMQIAAHHADPRTAMCHDRARKNLDRHPQLLCRDKRIGNASSGYARSIICQRFESFGCC